LRIAARDSFDGTISGVDVLVGARGGELGLLLYTVFQIGDAAPSMRWSSFEDLADDDRVEWSVPISLGDSHRGYRVVATTSGFFDHVKTGLERPLHFAESSGERIDDVGVVVGAQVARDLNYSLGALIEIQHGLASAGDRSHRDQPLPVTGILAPTGTPIDYSLFVSVRAFEALHNGWRGSVPSTTALDVRTVDLSDPAFTPSLITAVYVGMKSKRRIFQLIEDVEDYGPEPLTAVLPGVTLSQLWVLVGSAEQALQLLAILIVVVALAGQITLLLATLDLRRREIAIYRALGAQPGLIGGLLVLEALVIGLIAAAVGLLFAIVGTALAGSVLGSVLKLDLGATLLTPSQALALAAFIGVSAASGVPAGLLAYRTSLQDGMRARF
ncbi:MAG: FtsX-like permease family protein, partial [Pseudomonadota bacterium]|nr:FtsX-like permease family protein [Pseudomonadota bacterium]